MKVNKTNAARLLDKAKIAYELIPYNVDESDLSAVHVAAELGENIDQVFKTLVLYGDKTGHFVCVVPGDKEVNLKLAARVSGNKSCDIDTHEGVASHHRIYPWRLFSNRYEETFPYIYSRYLSAISIYLCQRRAKRITNKG